MRMKILLQEDTVQRSRLPDIRLDKPRAPSMMLDYVHFEKYNKWSIGECLLLHTFVSRHFESADWDLPVLRNAQLIATMFANIGQLGLHQIDPNLIVWQYDIYRHWPKQSAWVHRVRVYTVSSIIKLDWNSWQPGSDISQSWNTVIDLIWIFGAKICLHPPNPPLFSR